MIMVDMTMNKKAYLLFLNLRESSILATQITIAASHEYTQSI